MDDAGKALQTGAAQATAAAKTQTSRLGKEAAAAKAKVTESDDVKKVVGIVVAVVALVAGVLAATQKKPEPVPEPKKKGIFW